MVMRLAVLVTLSALLPLPAVSAQRNTTIETARRQIEDLNVDAAIADLNSVLRARNGLSNQHVVRAYTLLGIAELTRGNDSTALAALHEALWLDPELTVDSLMHLSSDLVTAFGTEKARWSSILRVTSEPTGAQVSFGSRVLGLTPVERNVPADTLLHLQAVSNEGRQEIILPVSSQSLISVHFRIPQDTVQWPPTLLPQTLRNRFLAASRTQWRPSMPPPPVVPSELDEPDLFAVIGGTIGATVGVILSTRVDWADSGFCEPGREGTCKWFVGGLITGVVAFVGVLVGAPIDVIRRRGALRRYEAYQAAQDSWERRQDTERNAWVQGQVQQSLAETQLERQSVIEQNVRIRLRNAALGEPHITIEHLTNR